MSDRTGLQELSADALAQGYALAKRCLAEGKTEEAMGLCDKLQEAGPLAPAIYELRALASVQQQAHAAAFVDVRTALALARRLGLPLQALSGLSDSLLPQVANDVSLVAVSRACRTLRWLLSLYNDRAAEEICDCLSPHFGSYAPVFAFFAGVCRMRRGRNERAVADFEQAVVAAPNLWPAAVACGLALLKLDDKEGALRAFAFADTERAKAENTYMISEAEDALAFVSGERFSWRSQVFSWAALLSELGRNDEALSVLRKWTEQEKDAADAYLSQAVLCVALRRFEEALAALDLAQATLTEQDRTSEAWDPLLRIRELRASALAALGRQPEPTPETPPASTPETPPESTPETPPESTPYP